MYRFLVQLLIIPIVSISTFAITPPGDDYKHSYRSKSTNHEELEINTLHLEHYKHSIKVKHAVKHYIKQTTNNSNIDHKKHQENYKRQF